MAIEVNQLRHISSLCFPNIPLDASISDADIAYHIRSIIDLTKEVIPMSADELALNGRYTRKRLKQVSTWPLWLHSECKQLEKMHSQQMFGTPCTHNSELHLAILFQGW